MEIDESHHSGIAHSQNATATGIHDTLMVQKVILTKHQDQTSTRRCEQKLIQVAQEITAFILAVQAHDYREIVG